MSFKLHPLLRCLIALVFIFFVAVNATKRGLRIAAGQKLKYLIPYQVSLRGVRTYNNGTQYISICSGTILNEYWIMTAAHCVTDQYRQYHIFAGSNIQFDGHNGVVYSVIDKKIFPYYDEKIHDIALLKVRGPIKYIKGKIEPAEWKLRLGNLLRVDNGIATISGWGKNEYGQLPGMLYTTQVNLLQPRYCSSFKARGTGLQSPKFMSFVEKYLICSLSLQYAYGTQSTPCAGDSGSPIIFQNNIIGIVSHGANNGCPNSSYEFYTKVEPYLSWIRGIIRNH